MLYWFGWFLYKCFFDMIYRRSVTGSENIPRTGGVIIASNHMSFADPPLVGSSIPGRPLFFMAKQELFRFPVFGWILKRVHAFPVRRGEQDIKAFRQAIDILKDGNMLLLFPEGTRIRAGKTFEHKPGAGFLVSKTRVPVVPALITNSDKMGKFKKISVRFGKPMYFETSKDTGPGHGSRRDDYIGMSQKIMNAITELKHE